MIELVIIGIYILAGVSGLLIFLLLFKIIRDKMMQYKDEILKKELKEKLNHYLAGTDDLNLSLSRRKKRLLQEIIMNYLKQVKGETKQQLRNFAAKCGIIDFKIEQLINSNQWWRKSEAAYTLGELGATEAIEPLVDYLDDNNSDIRYQSALALVKISDEQNLALVITKLLEFDFYPQEVILRLIEEVEADIYEVMLPLISSQELEKRVIALRSLGLKQDYNVLAWIKKYLKSETVNLVVASLKAAYQLGDIGDEDYFELLLESKDSSSPQVRANLAQVLEKFRTKRSRNELQRLMTDPYWKVRYNAAQSLLAHGAEGIIALSQQLESTDKFAQDMAWQILHKEIIFNNLFDSNDFEDYDSLLNNIRDYLIETDKEGVLNELENYFN